MHTGVDTKLIMNLGKYIFKQSRMEKNINWVLIANFISIFLLISPLTFLNYRFASLHAPTCFYQANSTNATDIEEGLAPQSDLINENHLSYLYMNSKPVAKITIEVFFSFFLILTSLTPIDIIASMELFKVIYAQFLEADAWFKDYVPDLVAKKPEDQIEGLKV